ncbi:glycoside hydrolase family 18 protein [Cytobacillus firmus]|nr:glycoside hydrolase family 18 protein [Cytobacillus firmus]
MREGEVLSQVLGMMNKERDWTCSKLGGVDIEYLKNLPSELKLEFDGKEFMLSMLLPK